MSGSDSGATRSSLTPTARTNQGGINLINGTQNVLSIGTPNDGNVHAYTVAATQTVTVAETGGVVQLQWTSKGVAQTAAFFPGGGGLGTTSASTTIVADPNTAVNLAQSTALTAGAASVNAAISGG
jgi:hypothetical protein